MPGDGDLRRASTGPRATARCRRWSSSTAAAGSSATSTPTTNTAARHLPRRGAVVVVGRLPARARAPVPGRRRRRGRRRRAGSPATSTSSAATTGSRSAGDSAGGNLAAVVAQALPRRPVAGAAADLPGRPTRVGEYPSRVENAEGYFLDTADDGLVLRPLRRRRGTTPATRGSRRCARDLGRAAAGARHHRGVRPAARRGRGLRRRRCAAAGVAVERSATTG